MAPGSQPAAPITPNPTTPRDSDALDRLAAETILTGAPADTLAVATLRKLNWRFVADGDEASGRKRSDRRLTVRMVAPKTGLDVGGPVLRFPSGLELPNTVLTPSLSVSATIGRAPGPTRPLPARWQDGAIVVGPMPDGADVRQVQLTVENLPGGRAITGRVRVPHRARRTRIDRLSRFLHRMTATALRRRGVQ